MRFEPRVPDESVNVSPQHPLQEAALLAAGVTAIIAGLVVVVTQGVDLVAPRISPEVERRAFASLTPDFVAQLEDDVTRARRAEYAQRIVDRLLLHWPQAPMHYRVGVLSLPDANAAALPGGWILVTEGLFDEVESENELSLVLGHELGHFSNRDHLRRLGRVVVYSLAFATLVGRGGPSLDLTTLVGDLTSRSFDREQESEADLFGLDLVNAEYGHVALSVDFFKRRQRQQGDLGGLAVYLSTHPGSADRASQLLDRARERGWAVEGPRSPVLR